MDNCLSEKDGGVHRFWDNYIKELHKQGVKPPTDRWYIKHSERYIADFEDKKLKKHTPDDVTNYLTKMGRSTYLKEWQYKQIVDAIQKLFGSVDVPWFTQFDWKYWKNLSQKLPSDHATLARENRTPVENREINNEPSALTLVRQQHTTILKPLSMEIHRRNYSIRTEKTYEQWICRFILFSDNRSPKELGAKEVVAFLQYLAVKRNVAASTQNQALNALVFFYR